ncbi:integral membrane Yip1 family protein [Striga asiatica]|uniref:Integral membrane Yip1 family protein n=1 Tax=Striga asiatica TaxID=4170 RepID=A0A5A7RCT0_STRAF|nr:integral membrane Yip1 family protein [Striga asiatica]
MYYISIEQICAGAVMLTDIVFWCVLLPFMTGENFQLTLLIGCMHSVNAVFLILESALNKLYSKLIILNLHIFQPFDWFGLIYFILWSCAYVVFQWLLHACCLTWWPYPFLDLSTPWAPVWYLALALVHIPCYGLYVLLTKAKHAAFSRLFPQTFVRSN